MLYLIVAPGLACKQPDRFPDKLHIFSLLNSRDFDSLDKLLNGLQKAAERNVTHEMYASFAFETFGESRPHHEAILNHWIAIRPKSYAAHLAAGEYFWHFAQLQWANKNEEVSPEQRKRIDVALDQAARHAKAALILHPEVMEGHYLLMQIALLRGDFSGEQAQAQQALQIAPASFRIRAAHMQALSPHWKGSYEEMERFGQESQQYAAENPRLTILPGLIPWDSGKSAARVGDYETAIRLFTKAIAAGEYAAFYADRALAYCLTNDFAKTLADSSAALRLYPQAPEVLGHRAQALLKLDRLDEAAADLELAAKLAPRERAASHSQASQAEYFTSDACGVQRHDPNEKAPGRFERLSSLAP